MNPYNTVEAPELLYHYRDAYGPVALNNLHSHLEYGLELKIHPSFIFVWMSDSYLALHPKMKTLQDKSERVERAVVKAIFRAHGEAILKDHSLDFPARVA